MTRKELVVFGSAMILVLSALLAFAQGDKPAEPAPPASQEAKPAPRPGSAATARAASSAADEDPTSTLATPGGTVLLYGRSAMSLNADGSLTVNMEEAGFSMRLRLGARKTLETAAWSIETEGFIVRDKSGEKLVEVSGEKGKE